MWLRTRTSSKHSHQQMPKTKELLELFRAIGTHDLSRATAVSRKLAAQHGARGHYRAEKQLMTALNGAVTHAPRDSSNQNVQTLWLAASSLMPLAVDKKLSDLEL